MNQETKTNLQLINQAINLISAKFKQNNDAIILLQKTVLQLKAEIKELKK